MIAQSLSPMWAAMGNHLWQSSLFALGASLLAWMLRGSQARARYWLWLAASVKFLVPFSALVAIGSRLSWSPAVGGADNSLYFVLEEIIRPFPQAAASQAASASFFSDLAKIFPALLAAAWLCGFIVVLVVWLLRYRKISAALRHAVPLREGREVEALGRLASVGGVRKKIDIFLSPASLEPGVLGITRPALVWPEGISDRLEDAHLEAILAHEVWHVRRHDNLAAMVHMLVEAIFWFHPLVWWLGARLVEERERACDEEVLQSGSERQIYAESILKICEFCVGSPLACVSGVTGADLKKRIVHIMTKNVASKLNFSRKLLLGVAGVMSIALPIVYGLARPAQGQAQSSSQNAAPNAAAFASGVHISITPGDTGNGVIQQRIIFSPDSFKAKNETLLDLIKMAYGVQESQISGGPDWMSTARFNIDVKLDDSVVAELKKLTPEQHKMEHDLMFQNLLADQFKVALHRESRLIPGFALVIAQNGPKFQPAKPGDTYPNGIKGPDGSPGGPHRFAFEDGKFVAQALPMSFIAERLAGHLQQPVVDRTGLTGDYDFTLKWPQKGDPVETVVHKNAEIGGKETTVHIGSAALIAAVEEQLGLKLDPQTIPLPVLVIDRAEKPAAN